MSFFAFALVSFFSLNIKAQIIDSATFDLGHLPDTAFFKKYNVQRDIVSVHDIKITKLIWSLKQVRETDTDLRSKGVSTFTEIVQRSDGSNEYFLVAHYQMPVPGKLTRMSYYRVNKGTMKIEYQDIDDFVKGEWKKLN